MIKKILRIKFMYPGKIIDRFDAVLTVAEPLHLFSTNNFSPSRYSKAHLFQKGISQPWKIVCVLDFMAGLS